MKGHVAFNLLHDLMNMAVENRHRPKSLNEIQRPPRVLCAPTPIWVDGPQRYVGKHHDRRARRAACEIILQPRKLFFAEIAEAAGFEVHNVNESDEMHAAGIETVPARAFGVATVTLSVKLHFFVKKIVFARHVIHVKTSLRNNAISIIEFRRLRQMRNIASVNHERRFYRKALNLSDGLLQRANRIGVRRFIEAHMTVANLQEGHARWLCCERSVIDKPQRSRHPTGDGPQHSRPSPGHAFQNFPSAYAAIPSRVLVCHFGSPQRAGVMGSEPGQRAVYSRTGRVSGSGRPASSSKFLGAAG